MYNICKQYEGRQNLPETPSAVTARASVGVAPNNSMLYFSNGEDTERIGSYANIKQ
jgi:hypothetical protein